jgi:hypothetical protein
MSLILSNGFEKTALDCSLNLPSFAMADSVRINISEDMLETECCHFSHDIFADLTPDPQPPSRFFESLLFSASGDEMRQTIAMNLPWVGSCAFPPSQTLILSHALVTAVSLRSPGIHPLSGTSVLRLTDAFSPSPPSPTPMPTVTASPVPTESEYIPHEGLTEMWVASLSGSLSAVTEESIVVSLSEVEQERVVTVTFMVGDVMTVSNLIVVEQTRVAISWVVVIITQLQIYVTVSRRLVFQLGMTGDSGTETRISNAVMIGSSCGAACTVSLLVIAIRGVVQAKVQNDSPGSKEVEPTVNRSSFEDIEELGRLDADSSDVELGVDAHACDSGVVSEDDAMYV